MTSRTQQRSVCQRFHLQDISKGTNSIICGRRLTGKSVLGSEILQSRQNSDIVIFSSKYVASSYGKYFAPNQIFDRYEPLILQKLLDKKVKEGPDRELIIMFDDVAVNKDLWQDVVIRDMIRYGSSLGITSIFSIQYAGQLDEVFKRNIDYVFCFRDNTVENQRLMFSEFAGMFPSFEEFKAVLDSCIAEPYRCLVFDLKTPREDPQQSVFWYKASADNLVRYIPPQPKNETLCQSLRNAFGWLV